MTRSLRRNKLVRPSVANVDQLAIVIAPIFPKPDFLLIDRLIITALYKGITPILVINKSDQDELACDEIRKSINMHFKALSLPVPLQEKASKLRVF